VFRRNSLHSLHLESSLRTSIFFLAPEQGTEHLRRDPFERADFNSNAYWNWLMSHAFLLYGAQAVVAAQIDNFVKYPPRQKAASFNLDSVMEQLAPAIKAEKEKEEAIRKAPKAA
jgi:hypothetical protein